MELRLIEGHPCKKRTKKHAQTDKEKKNKTIKRKIRQLVTHI